MNDILGYAASAAVLLTFLMRHMLSLRLVALASNILFVLYGYAAHILPVLLLHIALLPINLMHLARMRWRTPASSIGTVREAAAGSGTAAAGVWFLIGLLAGGAIALALALLPAAVGRAHWNPQPRREGEFTIPAPHAVAPVRALNRDAAI